MRSLFGRDKDLNKVQQVLESAIQENSCHVVVIRGEAGIGKTALLEEIKKKADRKIGGSFRTGFGWATAVTSSSEAYSPLRECMNSLVEVAKKNRSFFQRFKAALVSSAPDWLQAVPAVGGLLAGTASFASAYSDANGGSELSGADSFQHQFYNLIGSLSSEEPILLILDDLHWVDDKTLDVVVDICLKISKPVVFLLSYRTTNPSSQSNEGLSFSVLESALNKIRRYLSPKNCYNAIDLEPLDSATIEMILSNSDELECTNEIDMSRLLQRAEGNPLFALGLAKKMCENPIADDSLVTDNDTIESVLKEQLQLLQESESNLMNAAAVIGRVFEVEYLAQLLGISDDEAWNTIIRIEDKGSFLDEIDSGIEPRVKFHHTLMYELIREDRTRSVGYLKRQHRKLLKILQDKINSSDNKNESIDLLVRAVKSAEICKDYKVAHKLAIKASEQQLKYGAVKQAVELGELALAHAENGGERISAADVLMKAYLAEASHEKISQVFKRVSNDVEAMQDKSADLVVLYARSLRMLNKWDKLSNILNEILSADISNQIKSQALMLRAEMELCGPSQDCPQCLITLSEVKELADNKALIARAIGHEGLASMAMGKKASAERSFDECIQVSEGLGSPYDLYEAIHWKSKFAMAILDLDLAESLLSRLEDLANKHGIASAEQYHSRDSSRVKGLQGSFDLSANKFIKYWQEAKLSNEDRALVTLALQVRELIDVLGFESAKSFISELKLLWDSGDLTVLDLYEYLIGQGSGFNPASYCMNLKGISESEYKSADAIFRFDVPDLKCLRGIEK